MENFDEKYEELKQKHLTILEFYDFDCSGLTELEEAFLEGVTYLKKFTIKNTEYLINEAIKSGKSVLAEGAQGSMLDVDYGTYPFVTSSNTTVAGACTGLGVSPKNIGNVLGIFKAYCTRVGGGPFPTELFDEDGKRLQDIGHEFGATTGRARRCGWIDIPALKYAVMLSGVSELYMMKTDVLNSFGKIKACVGYRLINGEEVSELPYSLYDIKEPILEEIPGWESDLSDASSYDHFPEELNKYIAYLEQKLEVPINLVSIGPDRSETIMRDNILV